MIYENQSKVDLGFTLEAMGPRVTCESELKGAGLGYSWGSSMYRL